MKYRKKPVVVEAVQFNNVNAEEISDFIGKKVKHEIESTVAYDAGRGAPVSSVTIETLEGNMKAMPGDWIIKGVNGEFYPCKPDIFEKTYQPATVSPSGSEAWVSEGVVLRPVVKWFAEQMELALIKNDHKNGWLNDDWDELYDRIKDEMKELYKECGKFTKDEEKIISEAADVANFAMMIADKFGNQFGQEKPLPTPPIN